MGVFLGDWTLTLALNFTGMGNLSGSVPYAVDAANGDHALTNGGQGVATLGAGATISLMNNLRANQSVGTFSQPGFFVGYRHDFLGSGDVTAHVFSAGVQGNLLTRRVRLMVGLQGHMLSAPTGTTVAAGIMVSALFCTAQRGSTRLAICGGAEVFVGGSGYFPYVPLAVGGVVSVPVRIF